MATAAAAAASHSRRVPIGDWISGSQTSVCNLQSNLITYTSFNPVKMMNKWTRT
jgi:hypothetical protein